MEDKNNIEIIKEVKKKPTKKVEAKDDRVAEIIGLSDSGFNINQIGSMLAIHTSYIKEVIEKENAKL